MSIQRLLLRVLLCVALILNGSGIAVAGTQMHMQHAGVAGAATSPLAAVDAEAICGDHADGATEPLESAACGDHAGTADCCEGSACDVFCPAGMLWTAMVPAQGWWVTPATLAVRPTFSDHPAPLLQSRYRPPIV